MLTIYSVMLVALGFLSAMLIGFMLVPAYRRRIARLAAEDIRRTMPLTEAEIRADKDRLRAGYAVVIHELETKIARVSLAAARRHIEINRRDAAISALESEIERLKETLEEHESARRVLEHTVTYRLPQVEQRLAEAKRLLDQRDGEIAQLTRSADAQARALDQANQINAQQRSDLLRTGTALALRRGRRETAGAGAESEREAALGAEVELLRAKSRDQALLIDRLQKLLVRAQAKSDGTLSVSGNGGENEISRLHLDLAEAEAALKAVQEQPQGGDGAAGTGAARPELQALKAKTQDQAAEIARLTAALAVWESGGKDGDAAKDGKIALKARIGSLEAQAEEQAKTIRSLRVEIAAANERLARQAAHFREELRRLGASASPVAPLMRADRSGRPETDAPERTRRPLSERLQGPQAPESSGAGEEAAAARDPQGPEPARVSGFLKALSGEEAGEAVRNGAGGEAAPAETAGAPAGEPGAESPGNAPQQRPRLLDRISSLVKPPG